MGFNIPKIEVVSSRQAGLGLAGAIIAYGAFLALFGEHHPLPAQPVTPHA